jgi:hypothetical protein
MNKRFWILILTISLGLAAACKSSGSKTSPGQTASGTGAPPASNPSSTPPPAAAGSTAAAKSSAPAQASPAASPEAVPASAQGAQPAASLVAAAPAQRPYQDILKLKQAGLSDEFLLNKIHTENDAYGLTTSEIVELRSAGVSETVIQAMMRSGQPAAAAAGQEVARKAEFDGLARVGKGFLVFGTSAKKTGRLVVDGEHVSWFDAGDPKNDFSIYVSNIREVFNTCLLRPGQNLCLEFGFVTHTGDEYRFRDPGWKNGDNRLVTQATTYFRQAFPSLAFSEHAVSEM